MTEMTEMIGCYAKIIADEFTKEMLKDSKETCENRWNRILSGLLESPAKEAAIDAMGKELKRIGREYLKDYNLRLSFTPPQWADFVKIGPNKCKDLISFISRKIG